MSSREYLKLFSQKIIKISLLNLIRLNKFTRITFKRPNLKLENKLKKTERQKIIGPNILKNIKMKQGIFYFSLF